VTSQKLQRQRISERRGKRLSRKTGIACRRVAVMASIINDNHGVIGSDISEK